MPQSGAPADGAAAEPTSAATTPSAPAKASYLFSRPRDTSQPTRFLFCNLGPGAGLCEQAISALFAPFGAVEQVIVPSATSFFSFVVFERAEHATAALQALHGQPSPGHGSHALTIKYAIGKEQQQQQELPSNQTSPQPPLCLTAEETGIPGLILLLNFITSEEEQQLLQALAALPAAGAAPPAPTPPQQAAASKATPSGAEGSVEEGDDSQRQQPQECGTSGGLAPMVAWEKVAKRRACHFGYKFDYASRSFSASLGPLPPLLASMAERISSRADVGVQVDQITANEYPPGVGLAAHIDTHYAFTGPIVSLSLGSHCTMELRQGPSINNMNSSASTCPTASDASSAAGSDSGRRCVQLFLPARSLLIMSGESRYAWQHGITARKWDDVHGTRMDRSTRVSITLRKVRGFACDCAYPDCCDSQSAPLVPTRLAQQQQQKQQQKHQHSVLSPSLAASTRTLCSAASQNGAASVANGSGDAGGAPAPESALKDLEQQHVVQVYDAIANHFSATRFAIWPKVREFIDGLPSGALVADVGCGNGKYFGVRDDIAVIGSDRSPGLAEVASRRLRPTGVPGSHFEPGAPAGADVFVADALALPFRVASCDAALCIAVLHHMSSVGRRLQLLQQLLHILRPGGRALVTVWAVEQEDMNKTVKKWTPIPNPELAAAALQQGGDQAPSPAPAPQTEATESAAHEAGTSSEGKDFLVPWHLPCHRPDAQGALKKGPASTVSASKNAVVFQRYYHLFTEAELRGLVQQVPGAKVIDCFYDKSNWCIVYERNDSA